MAVNSGSDARIVVLMQYSGPTGDLVLSTIPGWSASGETEILSTIQAMSALWLCTATQKNLTLFC